MPNPMFLQVMKVSLNEYMSYSPAKKERFQKEATKRIGELHETNIEGYIQLTEDTASAAANKAIEDAEDIATDKEFE